MRSVPEIDFPPPGKRTRLGYLMWLGRRQVATIALATWWDLVWLFGLALLPWTVGKAIDEGVVGRDWNALLRWASLILLLSLVRSVAEPLRDRTGISNYNQSALRTAHLVNRHITETGDALVQRRSVGELVAIQGDALQLGHIYYLVGGLVAATLTYGVVALIVLSTSVPLGIFVLVGVPCFAGALLVLRRPLQRHQERRRAAAGEMSALAADAVAGLRVLRGIGGEEPFAGRYQRASALTRDTGLALSRPVAALQALQAVLAGVFVVALSWIGGLLVVRGDLRPGELVTFYGYAGFLITPIRLFAEAISRLAPALIGAGRVLDLLAIEPATARDDVNPAAPPVVRGADLVDETTGAVARAGMTVAVVSRDPTESAELLHRLARLDDGVLLDRPVAWGARPITASPLTEVRRRVVLVDAIPHLFGGTALRGELCPSASRDDAAILSALHTAAAEDIAAGLPDGLDTLLPRGGRSLSGGQRQRIALARALLTDAELLLLVEPTSGVDAHTEQLIAERLSQSLAAMDRGAVIATTSPLLLRVADVVHLMAGGRVIASGSHRSLAAREDYRATVMREGTEA